MSLLFVLAGGPRGSRSATGPAAATPLRGSRGCWCPSSSASSSSSRHRPTSVC
jgi:hypothetical protein